MYLATIADSNQTLDMPVSYTSSISLIDLLGAERNHHCFLLIYLYRHLVSDEGSSVTACIIVVCE